jgi:hypothetical protein
VPYATVPTPNSAHNPVMIAPIGNIRIFVPGRTKGAAAEAAAALAEEAAAAIAAVLAASAK